MKFHSNIGGLERRGPDGFSDWINPAQRTAGFPTGCTADFLVGGLGGRGHIRFALKDKNLICRDVTEL